MAMNTNNTQIIEYLSFVTSELNRYIPVPLLILGTIGNILNIYVFTRRTLRNNPCSLYFISGSIINCLALYIGLITPFLGVYDLDPTQTSNILCKIRLYLRFSTITLSTWFVLFACIDRYLSSAANINLRLWSSVKVAKRVIIQASLIAFTIPYTQVFYCYTIRQNNTCTLTNNICKLSNDITLLICNSGIPPILMVLISILTIHNVKYGTQLNSRRHRRDTQLSKILLVQVIVLVLFATPITGQKLYNAITMFTDKSALTLAVDKLINQVSTEISYISTSTIFYIYLLTNKKFRKEIFHLLISLVTCQCYKANTVQPIHEVKVDNKNSSS